MVSAWMEARDCMLCAGRQLAKLCMHGETTPCRGGPDPPSQKIYPLRLQKGVRTHFQW